MRDYLRIYLGELSGIPPVGGVPYGLIQLGEEAYSKTGLGVPLNANTWDLNSASMFEYTNDNDKLSIVICDSADGRAVSFASKSVGELLEGKNAQKYRFKLRGPGGGQDAGVVVLRIERYHFDSFPDRLEVRVSHATGVRACARPRVRVVVANEQVMTDESVRPSSGRPQEGQYSWNQQLVMAYHGHPQLRYEVVDSDTGAIVCDGFYCLWELLAKEKEKFQVYGSNPLMTPDDDEDGLIRKIGDLYMSMRLWDSKEVSARVSEHENQIRELRMRANADKDLYNTVAPLVEESERKRWAPEFDRNMGMAEGHLDSAESKVSEMKTPAHSKSQLHAIKKGVTDDCRQARRDLDHCEKPLQNLVHAAARREQPTLRKAHDDLQQIALELEYAKQPIPGLDEDDGYELSRLQTERLDPLLAAADQAAKDFDAALAGIKSTTKADEMHRYYDDAMAAKIRMLELAEQAKSIADIVQAKIRERRRQTRQAARNQMLGTAMTGYQAQYPKTVTVPALCCCWL